MNDKKCIVLGYGKYIDKESQEEKIRINLAVDYTNENYKGLVSIPTIFMNYDEELINVLDESINNNTDTYYLTTDNIVSGKTKITKIYNKKFDN